MAPLYRTLSQLNPVHISPHNLFEVHFNIILPSTPRYPKWAPPFRFSDKNFYAFLISPMRATYPAHIIILYFITLIIFGEVI
jgi:hypothetical protein